MRYWTWAIAVAVAVVAEMPAVGFAASGAHWDFWSGGTLSDLQNLADNPNYLGNPTNSSTQSLFEAPLNQTGPNFIGRLIAKLTVPQTGNYLFWVASNQRGKLWLSTSTTFTGLTPIATSLTQPPPTSRQWTRYPEMKSTSTALTAGGDYYLLLVYEETVDNTNHAAAGWQLPDLTYQRPIPSSTMTTYEYPWITPATTSRRLRGSGISR